MCGGGGATRGASMAGLLIKWGNDCWPAANETWEKNFPQASIFKEQIDEVIKQAQRGRRDLRVDILHMSPPCQPYSPAHTVQGVNDESNEAALFACEPILKAAKPRIATLEQTFGITSPKCRFFLQSLIRQFIDAGYSLRWKIAHLANWVRALSAPEFLNVLNLL